MKSIIELIHPVHGGNSSFVAKGEDIFEGNPSTDVINLKNAQGVLFVIATGNNAGSGAATITVSACDNTTPSNTTDIAFKYQTISTTDVPGTLTACASTGLSVGTANTITLIEVDAASVAAAAVNSTYNNHYVRLTATESQSDAVDGAILSFLFGLRYSPLSATQIT